MKHTPGQWKIIKSRGNSPVIMIVTDDKTGPVICEIARSNTNDKAADARLIATAPKLLAACKSLREYIQTAGCGTYHGDMEMLEIINAVIAEAEGEEPA